MTKTLVPYNFQKEGAHWLAERKRALLADEPGLGKTNQAIMACDLICAKNILVIPPASAKFVWKDEIAKWSVWGYDVHVVDGVAGFNEGPKPGVNIINYDLFQYGFSGKVGFRFNAAMKRWLAVRWCVIIPDEAHGLKGKDNLRTRAILGSAGLNGATRRMWFLTGTPMPNHPGELWPMLAAMGATNLSYPDFVAEFCELGKSKFNKGKPIGAKKEKRKELNRLLRGYMKRRLKEFVIKELPALRVDDLPVPEVKIDLHRFFTEALGDKKLVQKKIKAQEEFVEMAWQTAISSNGEMTMAELVSLLESVGPGVALYRRWLGAVKAVSVTGIIKDELENKAYNKIVIFAHHKQVIKYLKRELEEYNPQVIDGSTSAKKREEAVHNFQHDPKAKVFIGNILAAGTALTLTAAHEIVVVEEDWVPANNAQAIMRCHRIGQSMPVRARFARLAGTLDDYISDTVRRKTEDILHVLGD